MQLPVEYNKPPKQVLSPGNREISIFEIAGNNIDEKVVEGFGQEWQRFNKFPTPGIETAVDEYFDILDKKILHKDSYAIDIGCGSGRWTKFLSTKVAFVEAIDPSPSIFEADKLLSGIDNVRLTKASINTLPFDDETFDFAMSVGVLHHIPDTRQAMIDCVKKIKKGGYFYTFLYYKFENRGIFFRLLFKISNPLRGFVSKLPFSFKKIVCDTIAVFLYMPFILLSRLLRLAGLKSMASKIPLDQYHNKSFFIIRNDALDRFGTRLEQRFTKAEIEKMMHDAGLTDVVFGAGVPYWHAVGKKV